jgi:hypothetical protein
VAGTVVSQARAEQIGRQTFGDVMAGDGDPSQAHRPMSVHVHGFGASRDR